MKPCSRSFRMKSRSSGRRTALKSFELSSSMKYEIGCAQLCGLGHTKMVGNVFVKPMEEYEEWFQEELEYKLADFGETEAENPNS